DITAQIGDPTGKSKVRPEVDQQTIEENMATYLAQVGKILKTDPAVFSWIRNSEWFIDVADLVAPQPVEFKDTNSGQSVVFPPNSFFAKAALYDNSRMQKTVLGKTEIQQVTLRTFLAVLRRITHSRLIERDMFEKRIENGDDLYMHEMMYPILQGIDSNLIATIYGSCDLEVGGTDQTFNMLMARDTMKIANLEQQSVLSFSLLEGTDGKEKMSKSLGNYIGVTDAPNDMYGKIMSIPDTSVGNYFELTTYTPLEEIEQIRKDVQKGKNPKEIKMRLAREIVAIYHGDAEAAKAEESFVKTFSEGGIPENIDLVRAEKGTLMVDVVLQAGIVPSKSEWRRLIDAGGVHNAETDETISDPFILVEKDLVLKVGKRRFLKITVK
ncbi:MAG: tyrosine--tRNA ligase, partial [Candidatus Paceibacter sp.]|nr:tyrosine--tRNA ligase [Candidatus Paceibacter sp.]